MSDAKPTKIAFETRYSDDSGVEFAVRYDESRLHYKGSPAIEFESIGTVDFPLSHIDWLIECLTKIKKEATQ